MPSQSPAGDQPARNVYQRVTDQVLAELAKGAAPWRKPWQADFGLPNNLVSRRPRLSRCHMCSKLLLGQHNAHIIPMFTLDAFDRLCGTSM